MICRVCASPMTIDTLVVADAVRSMDPGFPVPLIVKCRYGHTARVSPVAAALTAQEAAQRAVTRCAVCGVEIPRQRGAAPRKSCGPEHKRFIETQRARAQAAHNRLHRPYRTDTPFVPFRFVVEAQPWYRGAATAFRPLAPRVEQAIPTGPRFPEIPAAWLEGFRRLYPALAEVHAALPSTFPPLEDPDEPMALVFRTRRRRGRRRELPPEYPVHQI